MRRAEHVDPVPTELREVDILLKRVADVARLLPALTATNAVEERRRLVDAIRRGSVPTPRWILKRRRVEGGLWKSLREARRRLPSLPIQSHYEARLDELETELAMIEALGQPKLIRPLAARRFGTGRTRVKTPDGPLALAPMAAQLLSTLPHREEARTVPPTAPEGRPSLASLMSAFGRAAGLDLTVRVEPRLSAGAATGDRTVFLADRHFGRRESVRFAVHEVLGHAVAAANARAQPLRLFEIGTAGSFRAQEGLALFLEERAGVLDAYRLRVVAARVVATDRMHDGAPFGETARWLVREEGFSAQDAVTITERAYRGGGVARDVGYLRGWLEVRTAIASGPVTVDDLRSGRIGLDAARDLPTLRAAGLAREPRYRPSLSRSLATTASGTSRDTSPPSFAASFTMLEET